MGYSAEQAPASERRRRRLRRGQGRRRAGLFGRSSPKPGDSGDRRSRECRRPARADPRLAHTAVDGRGSRKPRTDPRRIGDRLTASGRTGPGSSAATHAAGPSSEDGLLQAPTRRAARRVEHRASEDRGAVTGRRPSFNGPGGGSFLGAEGYRRARRQSRVGVIN